MKYEKFIIGKYGNWYSFRDDKFYCQFVQRYDDRNMFYSQHIFTTTYTYKWYMNQTKYFIL